MLGFESVRPEKRAGGFGPVTAVLLGERMGGEVLGLRHRERTFESAREPRAVADVIGVAVRGHYPLHGLAFERALEILVPQLPRGLIAIATVNLCPCRPVRQQPKVDVVEREGQGHPQPMDARMTSMSCPGRGGAAHGKRRW